MPRIDAPTVAEHHARTRAALLAAARDILETEGAAAVTPAAVGARAGLARSSVYQYFGSGGAIVAAVVEAAFPPANAALARAAAEGTPRERVRAYVRQALALADDGAHRVAAALAAADLPSDCRTRLRDLHAEQGEPLRAALRDLGVADAGLAAALVLGLLGGAFRYVDAAPTAGPGGVAAGAVVERTLLAVDAVLDAWAAPSRPWPEAPAGARIEPGTAVMPAKGAF